jgi:hypothetical protein
MTPKLRNATRRHAAAPTKQARQKLWQAMRIMRSFTVADLCATCEVDNRKSVLAFLNQLHAAAYLARTDGNRGKHEPVRWRLLKNTGPHRPAVIHRGKTVWDRNTNEEIVIGRD